MDIYGRIGNRISQLKDQRKMTHNEIHDLTGISLDHVKAIMVARRGPRLDMYKKLANALDVSPAAFFPLDWLFLHQDSNRNGQEFYLSPDADMEEIIRFMDQNGWIIRKR